MEISLGGLSILIHMTIHWLTLDRGYGHTNKENKWKLESFMLLKSGGTLSQVW